MANNDTSIMLHRINTQFSSIYIQQIGIIQAGVLGAAIYSFIKNIDLLSPSLIELFPLILQFTTIFLIIMCIWIEYLMGALLLVWFATIWDVILPFGIGALQGFLIYVTSRYHDILEDKFVGQWLWFMVFAGIALIGCLSIERMYRKAAYVKENEPVITVIKARHKLKVVINLLFNTIRISYKDILSLNWRNAVSIQPKKVKDIGWRWGNIAILAIISISLLIQCFFVWKNPSENLSISLYSLGVFIAVAYMVKCNFYWKSVINGLRNGT